MEANQQTCLDAEKLGKAIDEVDNLYHALQLPMPADFHVRQLKTALPDAIKRLKEGFTEATGHNPWEE
jgi:hypothetical protein